MKLFRTISRFLSAEYQRYAKTADKLSVWHKLRIKDICRYIMELHIPKDMNL